MGIFKPTAYNRKYLLTHPWVWIRCHWHDITNAWDRARKGFAWCDLADMDGYLYELIYNMLEAMRNEENTLGAFPCGLTPKLWDKQLEECAEAFKKLKDATYEEAWEEKKWSTMKRDAFEKLIHIIDNLWI